MISKRLGKLIFLPLLVLISSAGISYGATTLLLNGSVTKDVTTTQTPPPGGKVVISPDAPRNAQCPLNGMMYTATEREIWETRRPIYAMLENSPDARPISGLNSADIVYEAVAEGGITRFGALFYCGVSARDTTLAPIRSARTTFINLASEYNFPLYVHAGGANCSSADGGKTCTSDKRVMALEQLESYGWRGSNDLDEFGIGIKAFKRDRARLWSLIGREVAHEHGLTASSEKLFKYAKENRKWTNLDPSGKKNWKDQYTSWTFKDASKTPGDIRNIAFGFWDSSPQFNVVWKYDVEKAAYMREQGGSPAFDLNDGSQLSAQVVIVQFVKELGPLDEHKHMLYEVIGTGKGLLFQDGLATEIAWTKKDRESRTIFTDLKGKKLELNRGRIYIEILPIGNKVTY